MKLKSLLLITVLFVLSAFAAAQTTQFSNNYFDVTFNEGPVTAHTPSQNDAKTSTNYAYSAENDVVFQDVTVRLIDHDIPTDYSSTNFYADDSLKHGEKEINRSTGTYQGHIFTYNCVTFVDDDGITYSTRTRYILINSREVYFIFQITRADYDDKAMWDQFEATLNIKR